MDLKKIRELVIAKNQYNFTEDIKQELNYANWINFIDSNQNYYTWVENTEEGKKTIAEIDNVPEAFRERVLRGLNKMGCVVDLDTKKRFYCMKVDFNDDNKKIWISFECTPTIDKLRHLLLMAKHLDALLLKDGIEIIDEKRLGTLV